MKKDKPRQLTINIDHLPYKELSPNSRCHYMVKARSTKIAREEIGWLVKAQWHDDKPMIKAKISYEFHIRNKRRRDMDNLFAMTKPWQDGLIDVGVIFFDDANHLEIGSMELVEDTEDKTIVTIEELKNE